jgi:hypothetical protein
VYNSFTIGNFNVGYGLYNNMSNAGANSLIYGTYNTGTASGNPSTLYGNFTSLITTGSAGSRTLYGEYASTVTYQTGDAAYAGYFSHSSQVANPSNLQVALYISATESSTDSGNKIWALYNASTNTTAGKVFLGIDSVPTYWGTGFDSYILFDSNSLNIVANNTTTTDALEFTAGSYKFQVPADTDIAVNFTGTSSSGVLTWMEDEDYFKFSDDVLMTTTEKLYFRDTAIYAWSSADGWLNLVADTGVEVNAPILNVSALYSAGDMLSDVSFSLTPTADPPAAVEGRIYADTDHHLYYYNGTAWKQLDN